MNTMELQHFTVFVIEPEVSVQNQIVNVVNQFDENMIVRCTTDLEFPLSELDTFIPKIIILELSNNNSPNIRLVKKMRSTYPDAKIIVHSTQVEIPPVVKIMKIGVDDYIVRDSLFNENLKESINEMIDQITYHQNIKYFQHDIFNPSSFPVVLYKASDKGIDAILRDFEVFPEVIDTNLETFLQTIGISILVSIGQGHAYPEGCYSLPAAHSRNYSVLVFTFRANDPESNDPRLDVGYFQLVMFVHRLLASLLPSTSELETLIQIIKDIFPDISYMKTSALKKLKYMLIDKFYVIKTQS